MQTHIPFSEIEAAWPRGLRDLFERHGVKLEDTSAPLDVSSIRFAGLCRWRWNADGDLAVEQP